MATQSSVAVSEEPLAGEQPGSELRASDPSASGPHADKTSDQDSVVGWGAGTELKKIFKRFGFEPQDDL